MKLTKEEKLTIESYDLNAESWAAAHDQPEIFRTELNYLRKLLPQGKLLEIGCGGGRDAQKLIRKGYDYLGTDISKGLLEVAKKNNPGATFINKSVYDLDFPKDSFDGFWAAACLLHIPKSKIEVALQQIRRVVRNGGIGMISLKEGKGEKFLKEDRKEGKFERYWSFYSREEFTKVLEDNGYQILHFRRNPVSEKTIWLIYFVKIVK